MNIQKELDEVTILLRKHKLEGILSTIDESLYPKNDEDIFGGLSHADFNRRCAEFNGISVVDLLNSPNMRTLQMGYLPTFGRKVIESLMGHGLTKLQATAVVEYSMIDAGIDGVVKADLE